MNALNRGDVCNNLSIWTLYHAHRNGTKSFANPLQPEMEGELAAIWLDKPINTSDGIKTRITEGMSVRIEDNKLIPEGDFTHKILGCFGTFTSSKLYIQVIDLETLKISNLILRDDNGTH